MSDGDPGLPYEGTMHETLGIRAREMSPDRVVLEMDVGPHVHQPMGLLHGGASAAMAESAASLGAALNCRPNEAALGFELSISHLRALATGTLTATATPVRKGRRVHVWTIDLTDEGGRQIAIARCSVLIQPLEGGPE